MAGKRCAPGFQRAENRYFDIKWRLFRIFGATRRFDRTTARVKLAAYAVPACYLEKRRSRLIQAAQ
jgi:hypothetical protein